MAEKYEIIILFDEYGTATFKNVTPSSRFLGVSALYDLNDEENIFRSLDKPMGLSKSKPLKNDKISKNRAKKIAEAVSTNNFYIAARYIDLNNDQLKQTTNDYLNASNLGRQIWRDVKERKDAHLLHSHILLTCIFDNILRFLEDYNEGDIHIRIIIDGFSYPKADLHIVHDYCSENLLKHVTKYIHEEMKRKINITLEPIKFFTEDNSSRERLIDCLNSVISRSLLDGELEKYDLEPRIVIQRGLGNRFSFGDNTNETILFLHRSTYDYIQNTKVQEKPLIIL